jgi:hypothetical protein
MGITWLKKIQGVDVNFRLDGPKFKKISRCVGASIPDILKK